MTGKVSAHIPGAAHRQGADRHVIMRALFPSQVSAGCPGSGRRRPEKPHPNFDFINN